MTAEADPFRSEAPETDKLKGRSGDESLLGTVKRPLTVALGGALVVSGIRRKSLAGKAMALAGGGLLYRGLRNRPISESAPVTAAMGRGTGASGTGATEVRRSTTVDAPAEDLQKYWRKPESLSKIMGEFAQVTPADGDRLHWRVEGPMGKRYSWETRFVEDTPGEVLRWETEEDMAIPSEWTVRYRDAPGERGTEVTLRAQMHPPGGRIGEAAMGQVDFALESILDTALRRFKSLVETGEIPTLERNPSARGQGDLA